MRDDLEGRVAFLEQVLADLLNSMEEWAYTLHALYDAEERNPEIRPFRDELRTDPGRLFGTLA